MAYRQPLDDVDRKIIELLRQDARRTVKDIAARVHLSAAPVKRRIERLERTGYILGYTVQLAEVGPTVEAFTEVRYAGDMNGADILQMLTGVPEVQAAYTTAGEVDAVVHIRASDIDELQQVIMKLRGQGHPVSTRTLIVLQKKLGAA